MKKAFTMIELVFVIVILGILASVAIPKLSATRDDAEVAAGIQRLSSMITNIGNYYTSQGSFDSNVSKMTNIILVDSSKNVFTADFRNTPAYFSNTAHTKLCLKIVADDTNGTLTISDENEGSSYCTSLVKMVQSMIKIHYFGGSRIYK